MRTRAEILRSAGQFPYIAEECCRRFQIFGELLHLIGRLVGRQVLELVDELDGERHQPNDAGRSSKSLHRLGGAGDLFRLGEGSDSFLCDTWDMEKICLTSENKRAELVRQS